MKKILFLSTVLIAPSASALTIDFDYSYDGGFFSGANASRRTTLEQAGNWLGSRINDTLAAASYSTIQFTRPDDTSNTETLNNVSISPATIRIYVGGSPLSGNTAGTGGPGGFFGSVPQIYRGQQAGVLNNTDFSPWGGGISFDSVGTSWYFDTDTSTDESFSGVDFFSVALHEIGHVLGIGTANSWNAQVSGSNFTGSHSTALYGSDVPLAAGNGHWQGGLTFNGEALAMDPTIRSGTRKRFTELDFAALSDIGWEVSPVSAVPLPPAIWLFSAALGFVFSRQRGLIRNGKK